MLCPEPEVSDEVEFDTHNDYLDDVELKTNNDDLHENHGKDEDCLTAPSAKDYFNPVGEDEWPTGSSTFFSNESRNAGDGIKGIICSALKTGRSSYKVTADLEKLNRLPQEQAEYDLTICEVTYDATREQTDNICQVMESYKKISQSIQSRKELITSNAIRDGFNMALREHGLSPEEISKISSSAEAKAKSIEGEALKTLPLYPFNLLPSSNDIRSKYKEGEGSIRGLLPCPEVKLVKHDSDKCNDSREPADLLQDNAPNVDRYYSFVEPKQIAIFC